METLFQKIGSMILGVYMAVASFIAPHAIVDEPKVGTTIPVVVAVFQTSLAASITTADMSMTLVSGTDKAGNSLAGYICFNLDEGTAVEEFVCGTASSTSVTGMIRGIDPVDGVTERSTLKKRHGRGASVKITNYPQLAVVSRALNGTVAVPNPLFYSTHPCTAASASTTVCDKNYVDTSVNQGAATATNVLAGIAKLSVAAASANSPIVVGDNDTRVSPVSLAAVTSGEVSALVGNGGTPGASNTYVTQQGFGTSFAASSSNLLGYFGPGTDGSSTLDGTATTSWASKSGSVYTLTADVLLTNLTISSGVTLETAGHIITGNGTLTNAGTIQNNGGVGGVGGTGANGSSGGTGGSAGAAATGSTLLAGTAGQIGGHGADWNGANITVAATGTAKTSIGSSGSAGGTGGGASNGASGGVNTAESVQVLASLIFPVNLTAGTTSAYNRAYAYGSSSTTTLSVSAGSTSGGGGSSGTNSSAGGGGGGSGGTGGLIEIIFKTIVNSASGIIQANGGAGGAGGNSSNAGTAGGGGGGGGGNGGNIFLIYNSLTDSGTIRATAGALGAGGSATGGGTNGSNGTVGTAGKIFKVVTPQ